VLSPLVLATFLAAGVLALLPVSRLRAAGWPSSFLAAYWASLVALGLLLVVARAGFRIVLPLLVVGYVAPIIVVRVRRRGRRGEIVRPGR
jgi:pilus assembly protein TadC